MVTLQDIENWRRALGLTKKELAAQIGISYPFLVNVLKGKRELSAATAAKFEVLRAESAKVCRYDDVNFFNVMVTVEDVEMWRKAQRVSKKELAKRLGMTYTFLVDILNGKKPLSTATALKFLNLSEKAVKRCKLDDIKVFAVRMTAAEYAFLCEALGVAEISQAEGEKFLRELVHLHFGGFDGSRG